MLLGYHFSASITCCMRPQAQVHASRAAVGHTLDSVVSGMSGESISPTLHIIYVAFSFHVGNIRISTSGHDYPLPPDARRRDTPLVTEL